MLAGTNVSVCTNRKCVCVIEVVSCTRLCNAAGLYLVTTVRDKNAYLSSCRAGAVKQQEEYEAVKSHSDPHVVANTRHRVCEIFHYICSRLLHVLFVELEILSGV